MMMKEFTEEWHMNIKEAAEQAAKLGLGMRRRNDEWPPGLIVFPTDTVDCCVLELETEGKVAGAGGNPTPTT